MGYYIDLERISIDDYKTMLKTADLIPSWRVVQDHIDEHLDMVKQHNIHTVAELKQALKTTGHVRTFSQQSGLPEQYVAVLRRVTNGYHPKPNRIQDFPCLAEEIVVKLNTVGIKNTLQLYPEIVTAKKRSELAERTGIDTQDIMTLTKLTDLSRIRWVNHTFASVLLEAGYDTAKKVAHADYHDLYDTIRHLNTKRALYKGNIGAHDMKLCVEAAQVLDFDIEY
jgi:hypothetical protein